MLNDIENYCKICKNKKKQTKVVIFEKGRHTQKDIYLHMCNTKLEVVTAFKYLGIYLFKNGSPNWSTQLIANHPLNAVNRLSSIVCSIIELPVNQKLKLFDTLWFSILYFGCEIFGPNIIL